VLLEYFHVLIDLVSRQAKVSDHRGKNLVHLTVFLTELNGHPGVIRLCGFAFVGVAGARSCDSGQLHVVVKDSDKVEIEKKEWNAD